jgi:predicted kinase
VLLDGNFPSAARRHAATAAAQVARARPVVVFVGVDAATAQARAAHRAKDPANVSDADAERTATLRAQFVTPTPTEGPRLVALDGARPPDTLSADLLAALL